MAVRQVLEQCGTNDPGVVHDDVYAPEALDRRVHQRMGTLSHTDVVVRHERFAARSANLLGDSLGLVGTRKIVDDDGRALAR